MSNKELADKMFQSKVRLQRITFIHTEEDEELAELLYDYEDEVLTEVLGFETRGYSDELDLAAEVAKRYPGYFIATAYTPIKKHSFCSWSSCYTKLLLACSFEELTEKAAQWASTMHSKS